MIDDASQQRYDSLSAQKKENGQSHERSHATLSVTPYPVAKLRNTLSKADRPASSTEGKRHQESPYPSSSKLQSKGPFRVRTSDTEDEGD